MAQRWTEDDGTAELLPLPPLPPVPPAPEEFADFYRRELPRLTALAAALAGTSHAEELAQDALLRAHRQWARVSRLDKPGAWARRVTINLCTSTLRRRQVEARAMARSAQRRQLDAAPPEVEEVWDAVRALPPRQAAAVALRYLEDLSIADIALALGCAEGTAKAHLHKARHTLATRLASEEADR